MQKEAGRGLRKKYTHKKKMLAWVLAGTLLAGSLSAPSSWAEGSADVFLEEGLEEQELLPEDDALYIDDEITEEIVSDGSDGLMESVIPADIGGADTDGDPLIEDIGSIRESSDLLLSGGLSAPAVSEAVWVNPLYQDVVEEQELIPEGSVIEEDLARMQEIAEDTAAVLDRELEAIGMETVPEEAALHAANAADEEILQEIVPDDILETVQFDIEEKLAGQGYYTSTVRIAEEMRAHFRDRTTTFTIRLAGDLTRSNYKSYINNLMAMAMAHTGVPTEGDYIKYQIGGGYTLQSEYTYYDTTFYLLTFKMSYYTDAAQEAQVDARVRSILRDIYRSSDTAYERVVSAYAYLCDHVKYDYDSYYAMKGSNTINYLMFTAYGALEKEKAVCQGYAVSLYRLLLEMGVDCRVIGGKGLTLNSGGAWGWEDHAWNIIKLGSLYYSADPTWDEGGAFPYQYFLLGSSGTFDTYHKRDDEYLLTAFTNNYRVDESDYRKTSLYSYCDQNGHTPAAMALQAATCTQAGRRAGTKCSVCGEVLSGGELIKPTGHQYTAWNVTSKATIYKPGLEYRTCLRCGEQDREYIGKLSPTITLKNISKSTITLKRKKTRNVKVSYALGDRIKSFKSSKPKVATISSKGKIKALKKGKTKITVMLVSGKKKSFWVRVK